MSIATGNAYVTITYAGTDYYLQFANVTSYDMKPVYAEDGYTTIRYDRIISGTAVVSDGYQTFLGLQLLLANASGKVDSVYVKLNQGTTEILVGAEAPDALNGPLVALSVTELNGRRTAVVTFSIQISTTSGLASSSTDSNPIVAHRWVSSFALDESGVITRTVTGTLILSLDKYRGGTSQTPATGSNVGAANGKAPWADLFRKAVSPLFSSDTPTAANVWRRASQTYAYNESGNSLIYTIVDKQAKINLPDAAITGTAEFSYERSLSNWSWATFRFNCELTGTMTTTTRSLVDAAVALATSRIDFKKSRFDRLSVTESEMLDKPKIRFELSVLYPAASGDGGVGTASAVVLAGQLGKHFSVLRNCPWQVPAYGDGVNGGVAGIPHWYDNTMSAKTTNSVLPTPVADVIATLSEACEPGTPTIIMAGSDPSFDAANAEMQAGPYSGLSQTTFEAGGWPATVERASTVTSVSTDTRMHRLQTLYTQGSDFVFQAGKADVVVEEVSTVKRVNDPPNRVFRPVPSGFIVIKDDWKVNFGDVDPAGHRTYIGVYTRTLRSVDTGGATTSGGYSTVSGRRQWWPSSQKVTAPLVLGYEPGSDGQNQSVSVFGTTPQSYLLGSPQAYA
jgi:hypothetical protein